MSLNISPQVVADFFRSNVDWDLFYSVVDTIGDSLNGRKDRFDKSDLFELSMRVFSDGKIEYRNEEGRDLYIPALEVFCEMKYSENSLFTGRGKMRESELLTLVNTMGNRDEISLPSGYAPYVLAVGSRGCAVVAKVDIEPHLFRTKDQLHARVPMDRFCIIRRPDEIKRSPRYLVKSYKQEKFLLQENFLKSFLV
jgi:hypothetical protein